MNDQTCCQEGCRSCFPQCASCEPDCPCVGETTPELVIAQDLLLLRERLGREWLAEYDGPPSTRALFERLTMWAKRTVEQS